MINEIKNLLKSKQQKTIIDVLHNGAVKIKDVADKVGIGEKCVFLHLTNIYKTLEKSGFHRFKKRGKLVELIGLIDNVLDPIPYTLPEQKEKLTEEIIVENEKKADICTTKTKLTLSAMISDLEVEIFEKNVRLEVLKEIRAKYA